MKKLAPLLALVVFSLSCASTPETTPTPPTTPTTETPAPATTETAPTTTPTAETPAQPEERSDADKALDAGRKPEALIAFAGVEPGMKVAEIGAGGGYTTELLARAVGPSGVVYGQNSKWLLERFAEKPWSERLQKPVMKNVVRVDREFDDPLPPEAKDLDVVIDVLFYHDTVWLKTDRAKMNSAIFDRLKPGGVYVILDHSAKKGSGLADVQTLHRIEQSVVESELALAGFVKDSESDAWRVPSDDKSWNASPREAGERRGQSDRFAVRFKKPG